MNKIDMQWYKYLKILSKIPREDNFDKFRTKNIKNVKKYMEETIGNELHSLGYVNSSPSVNQIITSTGLAQLRMLEDMRRKDITLIASVIAVIISLVALAKVWGDIVYIL